MSVCYYPLANFCKKTLPNACQGDAKSGCWVTSSEGGPGFHFRGAGSVLSCVCCPWIPSLQKVTSDLCRGTAGGGRRDLQRFPPTSTLKPTLWGLWGLHSQVLSGVRWGNCLFLRLQPHPHALWALVSVASPLVSQLRQGHYLLFSFPNANALSFCFPRFIFNNVVGHLGEATGTGMSFILHA